MLLRKENPGWGAQSILLELQVIYAYQQTLFPSEDSIRRYLKQEGFFTNKEPKGNLPITPCKLPKEVHEQWEMDAEGAVLIMGIGHHSTINVKDGRSKKYCMSFPVQVANLSTQPSMIHYQWCLRLAFIESGRPKRIQVDKDSVFIENSSRSPFPSKLHLWLLALGVDLCFIDRPPPAKNAMVERSHQTIHNQVVKGKTYKTWRKLFNTSEQRRQVLNEQFACSTLGKKAPLQAFPKATHSGRVYTIEQEWELLELGKVYNFLAKGIWYRKVSSNKGIKLGTYRYYVKQAKPGTHITITFCEKRKELIFHDVNELLLCTTPLQGITKEILMKSTTTDLLKTYKRLFNARNFPLGKK